MSELTGILRVCRAPCTLPPRPLPPALDGNISTCDSPNEHTPPEGYLIGQGTFSAGNFRLSKMYQSFPRQITWFLCCTIGRYCLLRTAGPLRLNTVLLLLAKDGVPLSPPVCLPLPLPVPPLLPLSLSCLIRIRVCNVDRSTDPSTLTHTRPVRC